jgi:hypothetical protein
MEQNMQQVQMKRKQTMQPNDYDEEQRFGANLEDQIAPGGD